MKYNTLTALLLLPTLLFGQEIQLKVYDSLHKEPIPFVTVLTNFGEKTITNEEGVFRLHKAKNFSPQDSVFVSCMGFTTFDEAVVNLPDSIIYLPEESIELDGVILTQQELTADEIIEKASEEFSDKYELSLTKKDFFMRESYAQKWNRMDMKIKKSSIKEFNQRFWDSLLATLPKRDEWHTESVGSLYGNWSKEKQKLQLIRAVELADTLNERGYEQIESKITQVLDKNVKANSYFKFKSGIFSTKIDRGDIIESENDSLNHAPDNYEKANEEKSPAELFHNGRKNELRQIANFMNVKKNKLDLDVLTNASRYHFELENLTYLDDTPVYVIRFTPARKKAKFKGTVYIDADRFAVVQMEYENTTDLRDFSLFGISFRIYRYVTRIKFDRFENEKYQLQYIENNTKFNTGIKRPMKIVEKNKFTKGRRKQNELLAEINMQLDHESKKTLLINSNTPLSTSAFKELEKQKAFSPQKRNNFDPQFWEGFTIVEPNAIVRSFRTTENK